MQRTLAVCLLVPLALAACGRAKPPLAEAHAAAEKAYAAAKSPEEKVQVSRDFLALYPESEYTLDSLRPAVYYLTERLAAPEQADALILDVLGKVRSPELRRDVLLERLAPLAALKKADDLAAVVAEADGIKPLSFSENSDVVTSALDSGAWQLALERTDTGLAQANADAFRGDYPERTFSDAEVGDAVRQRLASMLAAKGWALANLDRTDEALQTLDEAAQHDTLQFTGESSNRIGSYRGRILNRLGRHEEALQALAADALFGDDEAALTAMADAYRAAHGSDEGFDEYAWATRLATAKQITDFRLPDYQGNSHTFSELRNGEVALLAFWFPT